jgi:hypothetical protein
MDTSFFSLIFCIVGSALLISGIYLYFRQRAWMQRARQATGTVIDLVRQRVEGEYVRTRTKDEIRLESKYRYRPVVQFDTAEGRTITITVGLAERPAPYQVGASVEVLYDPNNPGAARLNRFSHLWFYTLMLAGFGVFTLGMGLLGLWLQ